MSQLGCAAEACWPGLGWMGAKQVITKDTISWFLRLWLPSKPQVTFTLSCFCFKMRSWLCVCVLQPPTETFRNTAEPLSLKTLGLYFRLDETDMKVFCNYSEWSSSVLVLWYPGHCIGPLWVFTWWPISHQGAPVPRRMVLLQLFILIAASVLMSLKRNNLHPWLIFVLAEAAETLKATRTEISFAGQCYQTVLWGSGVTEKGRH